MAERVMSRGARRGTPTWSTPGGAPQHSHGLRRFARGARVVLIDDESAARPVVLDKLRYMRGSEPLPGYDALTTEQIAKTLAGADAEMSRPCATTSVNSSSASRCWMEPRACFRARRRVPEKNARIKRKRRSFVKATRIERKARPIHMGSGFPTTGARRRDAPSAA
jgi:hypothetical protein